MKKQFLILFLFASASSFAQVRIGALAGGNLMTQSFSKLEEGGDVSSIPAYHVGVLFSVPISKNISFQPGLNYQLKGSQLSEPERTTASLVVVNLNLTTYAKTEFELHYLELPVNISLAAEAGRFKVTPYLGLYAACAMSGKVSITNAVTGMTAEESPVKFGRGDDFQRIDYGGQLGVGLEIDKLFFRLQYSLGLANISGRDNNTVKNHGFGLSVGYWIHNIK